MLSWDFLTDIDIVNKLILIFILGLTALSAAAQSRAGNSAAVAPEAEIKEVLSQPDTILIDVRPEQKFSEGHLEGAVNIPRLRLREEIKKAAPDKNTKIFVYCQSGYNSDLAKQTLERMGYRNVTDLGSFTDLKAK